MSKMRRHTVSFGTIALLAVAAYFWSALQPDAPHAAPVGEMSTATMGASPAPANVDPFLMEKTNAQFFELPPQF